MVVSLASTRRVALALPVCAALPRPAAAQQAAWALFKSRHLAADGRVVDDGNGGISHSEGQSWALFLAAKLDDRAAFLRVLSWTQANLARRADALLAWRWRPGLGVDDLNNATDADLYRAWALALAEERWPGEGHGAAARAVARDILRLTVRRVGGRHLLLPGSWGFEGPAHLDINPSYYVFPAFAALDRLLPDPAWAALRADGLSMLADTAAGAWGLPPDWVRVPRAAGPLLNVPGRAPRFGYDAVRVPLHLLWAGEAMHPAARAAHAFWHAPSHPFMPAWVDLRDGRTSPYPAGPGVRSIAARLAGAAPEPGHLRGRYYDLALRLLAGCEA